MALQDYPVEVFICLCAEFMANEFTLSQCSDAGFIDTPVYARWG